MGNKMRKMEEGKTKDYNREKREKRKREKGKEREREMEKDMEKDSLWEKERGAFEPLKLFC